MDGAARAYIEEKRDHPLLVVPPGMLNARDRLALRTVGSLGLVPPLPLRKVEPRMEDRADEVGAEHVLQHTADNVQRTTRNRQHATDDMQQACHNHPRERPRNGHATNVSRAALHDITRVTHATCHGCSSRLRRRACICLTQYSRESSSDFMRSSARFSIAAVVCIARNERYDMTHAT